VDAQLCFYPRLPAIELLANTLRFRHGMIEELG
jgi:hypothetical protein